MELEVIKLISRYKDVDSKLIQIENKEYLLRTNGEYIRIIGENPMILTSIDLEGGPMISIGDTIQNKKVKNIKQIKSFIIEFE